MVAIFGGTPGLHNAWACPTAKEALAGFARRVPDVVLVSLFLNDVTGTDFIVQARSLWPDTWFLLLVPEGQPSLYIEALESGACAYLAKPCSPDDLIRAIWTVQHGGAVVTSRVAKTVVDYFRARGSVLKLLTERERKVLTCLSDGLSQADIAVELGIDPVTVRTHVRNLLSKLDVHSTAQAVALYLNPKLPSPKKNGLIHDASPRPAFALTAVA